jgi:hypothetical protein
MNNKEKKLNILRVDDIYRNKEISMSVPRRFNRKHTLKKENYIIDKIYYKKSDPIRREQRIDSIIIELKGKLKMKIEISKNGVYFMEEYEPNKIINHYDNIIETLVMIYKNL